MEINDGAQKFSMLVDTKYISKISNPFVIYFTK